MFPQNIVILNNMRHIPYLDAFKCEKACTLKSTLQTHQACLSGIPAHGTAMNNIETPHFKDGVLEM